MQTLIVLINAIGKQIFTFANSLNPLQQGIILRRQTVQGDYSHVFGQITPKIFRRQLSRIFQHRDIKQQIPVQFREGTQAVRKVIGDPVVQILKWVNLVTGVGRVIEIAGKVVIDSIKPDPTCCVYSEDLEPEFNTIGKQDRPRYVDL